MGKATNMDFSHHEVEPLFCPFVAEIPAKTVEKSADGLEVLPHENNSCQVKIPKLKDVSIPTVENEANNQISSAQLDSTDHSTSLEGENMYVGSKTVKRQKPWLIRSEIWSLEETRSLFRACEDCYLVDKAWWNSNRWQIVVQHMKDDGHRTRSPKNAKSKFWNVRRDYKKLKMWRLQGKLPDYEHMELSEKNFNFFYRFFTEGLYDTVQRFFTLTGIDDGVEADLAKTCMKRDLRCVKRRMSPRISKARKHAVHGMDKRISKQQNRYSSARKSMRGKSGKGMMERMEGSLEDSMKGTKEHASSGSARKGFSSEDQEDNSQEDDDDDDDDDEQYEEEEEEYEEEEEEEENGDDDDEEEVEEASNSDSLGKFTAKSQEKCSLGMDNGNQRTQRLNGSLGMDDSNKRQSKNHGLNGSLGIHDANKRHSKKQRLNDKTKIAVKPNKAGMAERVSVEEQAGKDHKKHEESLPQQTSICMK